MGKIGVTGRYDVKVTGIEWSLSPSGLLLKNALFDPLTEDVYTLSSLPIMYPRNYMVEECGIGSTIQINQLKFVKVLSPSNESAEYPHLCPFCGEPLDHQKDSVLGQVKICHNPYCKGVLSQQLWHYCSYFGIPIGDRAAVHVVEALPHKALYDLYDLTFEDWMNIDLVGELKADTIVHQVEASRKTELEMVLIALKIPFVSPDAAHELARQVDGDWDIFYQRILHRHKWNGFYEDLSINWGLYNWFQNRMTLTDRLIERLELMPFAWDTDDILDMRFKVIGDTRYFEKPLDLRRDMIALGAEVPKFDDDINCVVSNAKWLPIGNAATEELYRYSTTHMDVPVIDESEYLDRTRKLRG